MKPTDAERDEYSDCRMAFSRQYPSDDLLLRMPKEALEPLEDLAARHHWRAFQAGWQAARQSGINEGLRMAGLTSEGDAHD